MKHFFPSFESPLTQITLKKFDGLINSTFSVTRGILYDIDYYMSLKMFPVKF